MEKITLHTFPNGSASRCGDDTIVQKLLGNGRFTDIYVHELEDGDKYVYPINKELPPISDTEILNYIQENHLDFWYDGEGDDRHIRLFRPVAGREGYESQLLCGETEGFTSLREAVQYVIEMEEL